MTQTVVGLYDKIDDAQKAVRGLREDGFREADISLVAQDMGGQMSRTLVDRPTSAPSAAAGGATAGAMLGGLGGLLVGIGALAIPGVGPVVAAGPLAAALTAAIGVGAGAVAGGAAGGVVGALVDMGVPDTDAQYYVEGVRRGGALLTVTVPDDEADRARKTLEQHHPVNVTDRAEQWRQAGWTGYNPNAQPYTTDPLLRDRGAYKSPDVAPVTDNTRVYKHE